MKVCGVYRIANLRNAKVYIGSSKDVGLRLSRHLSERSWNKYGEANFTFNMIEECKIEDRASKESYYIKQYDSMDIPTGFNMVDPVDTNHSEETKQKIGATNRRRWKSMSVSKQPRTFSASHKIAIGNARRGKKHTVEARQKIAKALMGNIPWNKGLHIPLSEETKHKIGIANKGNVPWNKG